MLLMARHPWGLPGDIPVPGDYNVDNKADLALYRPSTGQWFIRDVAGNILSYGTPWGLPGDTPVPGDFNADGKADLALYRPTAGQWFIRSLAGNVYASGTSWGLGNDIPVPRVLTIARTNSIQPASLSTTRSASVPIPLMSQLPIDLPSWASAWRSQRNKRALALRQSST